MKKFTLIKLLTVITLIAILSFPGEKKAGKGKPSDGMCVTSFLLMPPVDLASRKKRRFTLIELLVVIAIIAILASMLLPVLNKARDSAQSIKCTGNEKQMAQAVLFYTADNNDYIIPGYGERYENPGFVGWYYHMAKYLGIDIPPYALVPEKRLAVLHCPGNPVNYVSKDNAAGTGISSNDFMVQTNYAYTQGAGFGNNHVEVNRFFRYRKAGRFVRPASALIFCDGMGTRKLDGTFRTGTGHSLASFDMEWGVWMPYFPTVSYRHANRLNAGFADGHVETRDRNSIKGSLKWIVSSEESK